MSQLSFLSICQNKKTLRWEKFLNEMNEVMPWEEMCEIIIPFYLRGEMGRKPMPLIRMLKIYCLQQWYQLSDPGMEEAIYDRNSFQKFLKLEKIFKIRSFRTWTLGI